MTVPEILSPAGGVEQARAAVGCGADAVYLGLKQFSARASAANFDDGELRETVAFCHERGVKVYVAVNTIIFDSELSRLTDALKLLCETGVDALIVQDLAVVRLVHKCCPELELHASTQMTVHTVCGTVLTHRLGMTRAVLSRELDMDTIAEIAKEPTETEVFVHGALCMSVSGQCLMSAVVGGRSANRGACAQPCRLPCSVKKGREDYALSLKDMSLLPELPKLAAAGIDSLKIEGRMKRPEYAALSADCAVKALGGREYDLGLLENVFSRGGFTDGYLHGLRGREMFGRRTKEDAKNAAAAYPKIHELYRREYKRSQLSFEVTIRSGEPMTITARDENRLTAHFEGSIPEPAVNRPCSEELVEKQLSKLGDTFYSFGGTYCDIEDGLSVPASEFNRARRALCDEMTALRREHFSRRVPFDLGAADTEIVRRKTVSSPALRINACSAAQLSEVRADDTELCFLPPDREEFIKALDLLPAENLGVCMPRFTLDERRDMRRLEAIAALGIKDILCTNFSHIILAERLGLKAHAAAGLNTANTPALKQLAELSVCDAVVSNELTFTRINALGNCLPIGVTSYGRLSLMLTANCPISAQVGCKNCTRRVYDRTGRAFPIKCSREQGYVELLNSDILCISDKLGDLRTADFLQLELYDESPQHVREIIDTFKSREPLRSDETVTRGLYYRGVK